MDPRSQQCYRQVLFSGKGWLHHVLGNLSLRHQESIRGQDLGYVAATQAVSEEGEGAHGDAHSSQPRPPTHHGLPWHFQVQGLGVGALLLEISGEESTDRA